MNAESQPNLYAVYENCDPDYLRQLREAAGMDETTLARIACLSLAQVRQLQAGSGDGLFYSPTIKRQAYKRLLMILGAEPPQSIPEQNLAATEPVPAHEDMLHKLDQIVAMSTQTESIQTGQFALAGFTHGVTSFLGERRQLVGSLEPIADLSGVRATGQIGCSQNRRTGCTRSCRCGFTGCR